VSVFQSGGCGHAPCCRPDGHHVPMMAAEFLTMPDDLLTPSCCALMPLYAVRTTTSHSYFGLSQHHADRVGSSQMLPRLSSPVQMGPTWHRPDRRHGCSPMTNLPLRDGIFRGGRPACGMMHSAVIARMLVIDVSLHLRRHSFQPAVCTATV
jgi:hypothetical protein